ncbi:MAG: flagellin N-terminal helical domain-containing protein [Planctomycetota bacterium]|jgi:flagellin-like hook-associated protein FlgL
MALTPINTSRISFNQQTNSLLESLRRSSLALLLQQAHLGSGRRFLSPSEDPAAATQELSLEGALGRQAQIVENVRHASAMLDATDATITEVHSLLSDAHAIASQNAGSLVSADERAAAAELIADIVEQLTAVGNRKFRGVHLFAGRDSTNPPFHAVLGGVVFTGDTGDVLARVSELDDEPINLTGDELFGPLSGSAIASVDLTPRLTTDTRLEDVLGAAGEPISLGPLVITPEGAADPVTVDLSGADTLGDIIDLINDAAAGLVTASLDDSGITLTPVGPAVTITDLRTGATAGDLGLLAETATTAPIGGAGLLPRLSRTSDVADLAGGAGIDLTGGLVITNGSQTATIDLSAARTVQDILNAINNAGLYVRAQINAEATGIEVINLVSGTTLSIAEDSGTTAADLGLRTLDLATPVAALNFGRGVETVEGEDDIRITAKDGSIVDVNLDGLSTIEDVMDAINTAAAGAGVAVTASLAPSSSGIRLVDSSGGTGALSVTRLNLSYALDDLGLDKMVVDPATELIGDDIGVARADNVLTALVDLDAALRADDDRAITDAADRVNHFLDDVTRAQGQVGARAKAMSSRLDQNETAALATQQFLSELRDLDYAEAVTLFQQAQTALQVTLMTGSRSLSLSLMDFLG